MWDLGAGNLKKILFSTLILFILFCSFGCIGIPFLDDLMGECNVTSGEVYTAHDPIVIRTNEDFDKEGWIGDGSSDNPYTVSFFEFTDAIDEACINISDTTAYFVITNCTFETIDFACAINLQNVTNGRIQYCTTGSNVWGITVHDSANIQLEYLTSNACIIMEYSFMCNISHCSLLGAPGDGVYLHGCAFVLIQECEILSCCANGICLEDTMFSSAIGNRLQGNDICEIDVVGSSMWNYIYNNIVYYYEWGWEIASDNGLFNSWDDGVSIGNWWSDYSGSGNYSIFGSADSVDHYPMGHSSVVLVSHDDVQFEINSAASITWTAFSEVPSNFIIYRDGEIQKSEEWDGSDISISIPTDTLGLYNFTLLVNGISGDNKTDTVIVKIYAVLPYINSPRDITYQYGQTGNTIVWRSASSNPDRYEIYQDDILNCNETWDGSYVTYCVDGLAVGNYAFELRVFDIQGNNANDTVRVSVVVATPTSNTTTTSTTTSTSESNRNLELLFVVGVGGISIIVIILIAKLRR